MNELSPAFRRGSVPAAIDTRFLDRLPSGVLLCDPVSFVIRYANGHAVQLMKSVPHMLPVPPEEMVGSSLCQMHPAFGDVLEQLHETGDEARRVVLNGHGERLDFHVQALKDPNGRPGFLQVTWSVTTALMTQEEETLRLRQMVEHMPLNVMTCRLPDLRIDYANAAARAAFETLRPAFPAVAELVGAPVDIFVPADRLAHGAGLPFSVEVPAGHRRLTLRATALWDSQGAYAAALLTFEMRGQGADAGSGLAPRALDGSGAFKTDEVLESLRTSIGRIRSVAETIERISARPRLPEPAPPGDADLSAPQTLPAAGAPVGPEPVLPDVTPGTPALADDESAPPVETAHGYVEQFRQRVERLWRGAPERVSPARR